MKPLRLFVLPYKDRIYTNVISYISMYGCITTIRDWSHLAAATDLRVIHLKEYHSDIRNYQENKSVSTCTSLQNTSTFVYVSNNIPSPDLPQILSCKDVYSEMAEVEFNNMLWSELPGDFRTLFPNLQSLELPNNKFILPPKIFPWTTHMYNLPRNLSRTAFMQTQYSDDLFIEIPANIFRRVFNLAFNSISNLTGYHFHGHLHIISLQGNGLHTIGAAIFQNVTGLQRIDISKNQLRVLPEDIFKTLNDLRSLNIDNNMLTALPEGLFDDLKSLRHLDLSYNFLKALPAGFLKNLLHLVKLLLQNNTLTTLDATSFPLKSPVFQYLYCQNNPITTLPEFIFWITSLSFADFSYTNISLDNLTEFIKRINLNKLETSVVYHHKDTISALFTPQSQCVINLMSCDIRSLYLTEMTSKIKYVTTVLLQNFKFVLTINPITCDCKVLPLNNLLNHLKGNGTIDANEYYFQDWHCRYPRELRNRKLLSIKPEETYCPARNISCPHKCKCSIRSVVESVIVDCRNLGLIDIHNVLPNGTLELWYSNKNLTALSMRHHLRSVKVIDISSNQVSTIHGSILKETTQLEILNVQSNLLTYLPKTIQDLNLKVIKLSQNNFRCDCKSLWMKYWIMRNKRIVEGWERLTCNNQAGLHGRLIIEVKDSEFVCIDESDYYAIIITCSVITCLIIIFSAFVYTYRLECKVLIYVYFGFHPFDRNEDNEEENIDCVIVHSETKTDWVINNVVNILEGKDYRFVVCDMKRDFIAGFSVQENLTHAVQHSKRIIFCISRDWQPSNDTFKMAWRIAREKVKEKRLNYQIIVGIDIIQKDIIDKRVQQFLKRRQFIDSTRMLMVQKIIYFMPRKGNISPPNIPRNIDQNIQPNVYEMEYMPLLAMKHNQVKTAGSQEFHAFISYSDDDYAYSVHVLRPCLEAKGLRLCIPDREFIPGASIEENVIDAINSSKHTVLVISKNHVDEWALFTFRVAFEKSLREKKNHLIVILMDNIDRDRLDKEIKQYLNSYVSLSTNERWYEQKMFDALPSQD